MFVLIGEGYNVVQHEIGGDFFDEEFERNVALFDTEQKAKDYAEQFRLKKAQQQFFSAPQVFKRKSPMCNFTTYRVETYVQENLPVNP